MNADPITKKIAKDGTVSYWCRIDVGLDPATGKRRQRRSSHKTQREARAWLAERRVEAARGTYSDRSRTTLGEFLVDWQDSRLNLRETTRACYRVALQPYIDEVGGVPLQALGRQHLEHVRDRLLSGELRRQGLRGNAPRTGGKPLAARTVRLGLGLVQQALDDAERDGLVPRNVARHVERPAGDAKAGAAWSAQQAQAFRDAALTDRLAGAWALSLLGLRRGEVLGMQWSRIDLDAETAEVAKTRVLATGVVVDSVPKTARGRRTVPLPRWAVEALRATLRQQDVERRAAGDTYVETGLVAVDAVGHPVRPEWYSETFTHLARVANVPVIRLHDARHTSVTIMRAAGVPDAVTAAWHGHSEAVMRATYTHVSVDDMRRHAEAL